MIKTITCIECPNGCQITVNLEGKEIKEISGYICPRGKTYAENEVTEPRRVLTTTVKTDDGRVVAVKTDKPIRKENIFEVMNKVNMLRVKTPVQIGNIVCHCIDEDINLIATSNLN